METVEQCLAPRAGVIAAIFHNGRLLLVQRAKAPYRGLWALPGGGIEPGEEAWAAILRELAEETGLAPELYGVCSVADVILRDGDGRLMAHHVLAVFAGEAANCDLRVGGDAEAALWADSADMARLDLAPETERCAAEAKAFLGMKSQSRSGAQRGGLPLAGENR